jgi:membrane fusion protein (multidrug efflux system)
MLSGRLSSSIALASLLAAASVSAGCKEEAKGPHGAPPPPTVFYATIVRKDVPLFVESVATLDGYINADIRARVRGYLKTQDYKDGAAVKANQRLFSIEATEYETALSAARAALARAKAAQQRTSTQLQRDRELFQHGAVAQQEIDNASAGSADAEGQVAAAQAQIEQAQLNLSYTQIRSPVDGVAGVASVRVGNLVGQDGPTLLTTVSQIDPIRVTFPLSELDYVKYPKRFKALASRDLKWAKKQFEKLEAGAIAENDDPGVELLLSDGSVYPHRGIVVSASRQIDATTGTIQLQALVQNPDGFLRPGQFGRVRLRRENEGKNTLSVPDKALISVQGTYSVGVVGEGNKVQLRRVEVGPSVNGLRLVSSGIREGERVVVDGVQKISDGAVVNAKPAPEATASAAGTQATTANN